MNLYHKIMARVYGKLYRTSQRLKDYFCRKAIDHSLAIERKGDRDE